MRRPLEGKPAPIPAAICTPDEVSSVLDRLKAGKVGGCIVAKVD